MNKTTWKILRVLTTNKCNYECVYCHNEGQEQPDSFQILTFNMFKSFFEKVKSVGFEEVRFSGGEPLSNKETILMIEWLNNNSNVEIGLATNGSLVTKELAERIGKTRTMVTLHFPGVGEQDYSMITKRKWAAFERCVKLFDEYSVNYSFNYTLYPKTLTTFDKVLDYVVNKGKRIKLLPFLEPSFQNVSKEFIPQIVEKLNVLSQSYEYQHLQGYHRWRFKSGSQVKLIDSPCYNKDINMCKEYGELRLLPDNSLMNCIFGEKVFIDNLSQQELLKTIVGLFDKLKSCESVLK